LAAISIDPSPVRAGAIVQDKSVLHGDCRKILDATEFDSAAVPICNIPFESATLQDCIAGGTIHRTTIVYVSSIHLEQTIFELDKASAIHNLYCTAKANDTRSTESAFI